MAEYIEKMRITIGVSRAGEPDIEGCFSLSPLSEHHSGAETLLEFLNERRRVLPFLERLGIDVPPWDFRVAGVTEMSADVHKYGYCTKGASVIAHRAQRSPDCTGRLMTFAGPHGQAVQCVCFAGTLSTCFDPGP